MNLESGEGESCTELEGIQHETSLLPHTILKTGIQRFHSSSGDKNLKGG